MTVAPSSVTLLIGQAQQLTATANYSDGSQKDITSTAAWSSSDSAVATVSPTGLLISVTAGQANISASVQGLAGSDAVTVSSKTPTSVAVTPATANLGLGITQQYDAIATYDDGSTADVTQFASWSSSSSSKASASAQGMVRTISPGSVNITAAVGNVQGSAPLVVNSSTDGLVFIDDLTDSRLISYTAADGSTAMLYGSRDASGNPSSLSGLITAAPDGMQAEYSLDAQGRPTNIRLSDGSEFLYSWASSATGVVSVIGSDGAAMISAPINLAQTSATAGAGRKATHVRSEAKVASTTASNGPTITVHVTSCNGTVSEDWADVLLNPPGGFVGASLAALGTGDYVAQLPSGSAASQAASQIVSGACGISTGVSNVVTVGCAAVTAAVVVAGTGLPAAQAAIINTACAELGLSANIMSGLCKAASALTTFNSAVTWVKQQFGGVPITVSLGSLAPIQTVAKPSLPGGPYPPVNVDFPCPPVDHVDVVPGSATIDPGQSVQLNATARDSSDKILFSSAFDFTWSGAQSSPYVTSSPEFQGFEPFGTDTVTGIAAGGPVGITASETTSGQSGTSQITVAQQSWQIQTVDAPATNSNSPPGTVLVAVNDNGDVLGVSSNAGAISGSNVPSSICGLPFVYSRGSFTNLALPSPLVPGTSSCASVAAMNNYDQAVGISGGQGIILTAGGVTNIPAPAACPSNGPGYPAYFVPAGINDNGDVVGTCGNGNQTTLSFLYSGGAFTAIAPPGSTKTIVTGINNSGDIVGYYQNASGLSGFLYSNGTYTDFSPGNWAFQITNDGQILVGGSLTNDGSPPAYVIPSAVNPNSGWTPLPPLPASLGGVSNASMSLSYSNTDQLVGMYTDSAGNTHGFIATPAP